MTIRKKIASLVLLLAGLAGACFGQQGQSALTATNLSSAISSSTTQFCLSSVTGINGAGPSATPVSWIYVDREAIAIMQVNTSSGCVSVRRGDLGTRAANHSAGEPVVISAVYQTQLGLGANPASNGFDDHDPSLGSLCYSTSSPVVPLPPAYPLINVLTGAQWLCSTLTNQWVPGFQNPWAGESSSPTTAVASAAAITPTGPLFHVTGTSAISLINVPVGFAANGTTANVGGGQFCAIPDAAFTTATGGTATATAVPLKKASTAVAGQVMCFTYDPVNKLFDASY
jgi:hypothetical protein